MGWIVEDRQGPVQLPQLRIRLAGRERLLLLNGFVYRVGRSPTGTATRSGSKNRPSGFQLLSCGASIISIIILILVIIWLLTQAHRYTLNRSSLV